MVAAAFFWLIRTQPFIIAKLIHEVGASGQQFFCGGPLAVVWATCRPDWNLLQAAQGGRAIWCDRHRRPLWVSQGLLGRDLVANRSPVVWRVKRPCHRNCTYFPASLVHRGNVENRIWIIPNVRHWVEPGRIRRQRQPRDIFGQPRSVAPLGPAGLVPYHRRMRVGCRSIVDLFRVLIHRFCVGRRHDHVRADPARLSNGANQVGRVPSVVALHSGR